MPRHCKRLTYLLVVKRESSVKSCFRIAPDLGGGGGGGGEGGLLIKDLYKE